MNVPTHDPTTHWTCRCVAKARNLVHITRPGCYECGAKQTDPPPVDPYVRLRDAAQALVDALPKCDECKRPAMRLYELGSDLWCDEHAAARHLDDRDAPEYPRAAPLRALIALLEAK